MGWTAGILFLVVAGWAAWAVRRPSTWRPSFWLGNINPAGTPRQYMVVYHFPHAHCAWCDAKVYHSTREIRTQRGVVYCTREHLLARMAEANKPKFKGGSKQVSLPPRVTRTLPCPRPDKHAFDTWAECADHFKELLRRDLLLEVYQCVPGCRRFHAGHPAIDPAMTIGARARIVDTRDGETKTWASSY